MQPARQVLKRTLRLIPSVRRYLAEKNQLHADRERLKIERANLLVERDRLSDQLRQAQAENIATDGNSYPQPLSIQPPNLPPAEDLINCISSGRDLNSLGVHALATEVETTLTDPAADKIGIHREIGKALFARSVELYSGRGLPHYLVRYTYPPFISIALNSHCNAACFFCRESDYKGTSIDFDDIFKLESAIRNARTIDLTGWGEPFFYPKFEDVVDYVGRINDTKHLIQITTNGSFLSKKWGKMLAGKINCLVISLNAATPEIYANQMRYKNSKFDLHETLQNIRAFQAELTEEDRKRFILHMVANTGNYREASAFVRLAGELHIPLVNISHFICADKAHLDKTLWNVKHEYNAEVAQARETGRELGVVVNARQFFTEETAIKGAESCMAPFEQFFVEMPGTSVPCCFMGAERMGNVYQDGFEPVWFSDIMNKLRKSRFLPPCHVCTIFTPFDNEIAHKSAFLTTEPAADSAVPASA
jgi:MoaA/NifB/PqqE/SkfB family radical SAM enzyme